MDVPYLSLNEPDLAVSYCTVLIVSRFRLLFAQAIYMPVIISVLFIVVFHMNAGGGALLWIIDTCSQLFGRENE